MFLKYKKTETMDRSRYHGTFKYNPRTENEWDTSFTEAFLKNSYLNFINE